MNGAVAIVLAAGRGERLDPEMPKALVRIGDRSLVARSVEAASAGRGVEMVVVVAPAGFEEPVTRIVRPLGVEVVVTGGTTRQASVRAGLGRVPGDLPLVVCHDAARPFASADLFGRVLDALDGWDGVVPTLPVIDTVKRVAGDRVEATEPRETLALAQTPQAFTAAALRDAHAAAERDGFQGTDDAALLERAGLRVRSIAGERRNLKITTRDDVLFAAAVEAVS